MLSVAHLANATAAVTRVTRAASGVGFPETTTVLAASAPCRRVPLGGAEVERAAALELNATHAIYFPEPGAPAIERDDRITIAGVLYEARRTERPSDTLYLKVYVEEIQQGA